MTDVTIGVDIGTTSVKALAVDADGRVLARSRVPHDVHAPSADIFEHDADQAWRLGPQQAVRELGVSDPVALAVASMVPSITAVDDAGHPVIPGLLYGDHRGRTGDIDPTDLLSSGETRAMLDWARRAAPEARGYWPAAAVAGVALGGAPAVDIGGGFALHPLWDMDWQADKLAEIGLRPDQMAKVVLSPDEPAGRIGGTVQAAAMADAWAEATVAGADQPGDVLVILGTTLIVWIGIPEHRIVPGLWTVPHPYAQHTVLSAASNAGGMFVNWARRSLAGATVRLDPHGIPLWVPYLRGERSPMHDVTRRASLVDVDLSQDPPALMRAAYEASGFATRRLIELAETPTNRVILTGGGVHDEEWVQALADCTGKPVQIVAVPEGAALGAAYYARVAAGLDTVADAGRWVRFEGHREPDPRWVGPCQERYERWRALAD